MTNYVIEAIEMVKTTHSCRYYLRTHFFTQIYGQRILIRIIILSELDLGVNLVEVTENICCAEGEVAVDFSKVTKRLKKYRSDCNNHDDKPRSGRPKTVDFEAVLQEIKATTTSSNQGVLGKLAIPKSSVVWHFRQKRLELWNCAPRKEHISWRP